MIVSDRIRLYQYVSERLRQCVVANLVDRDQPNITLHCDALRCDAICYDSLRGINGNVIRWQHNQIWRDAHPYAQSPKCTICYDVIQWHNASFTLPCDRHSLQWRHNGCDGVSNHQPHHCLLNRLFRRKSKETSKLRVTGLCAGNSAVTDEFPS